MLWADNEICFGFHNQVTRCHSAVRGFRQETANGVEEPSNCLFQDEPCREFLQLQTELSMIVGENALTGQWQCNFSRGPSTARILSQAKACASLRMTV